jgi:hypothetical protein
MATPASYHDRRAVPTATGLHPLPAARIASLPGIPAFVATKNVSLPGIPAFAAAMSGHSRGEGRSHRLRTLLSRGNSRYWANVEG